MRSLQQIDGFLLQSPESNAVILWMASSFFFDIHPDMIRPDVPEDVPEPETEAAPDDITEPSPVPEAASVLETEDSSEAESGPDAENSSDPPREPALESAEAKELTQAKKISREDLTLLPRKFWPLANNSFLLHGYHNYNHLVLIEEGGRRWLGVPGIYDTREARAADLFGFPRFTRAYVPVLNLSEGERNDTADFGHWCRCVGTI